jgi:cell division protein FtsI (penicillin-binding protein 3)
MSIKTDILWRVGLIYLAITAFALLIIGKIVYIQLIDDDHWKASAENTRIKNMRIEPHRGDIYASDMRLLASSVPYYEIRMDLKTPALTDKVFYAGIDSLALCLSQLFGDRTESGYKDRLVNARRECNRYLLIKNKVNYLQLKELRKFPIFRLGQYKGGLIVNQENVRKKPHQNLASRTIGYTTRSMSGNVVGIEGAYDRYLGGVEGIKRMQKLAGNVWMPLDEAGEIEPHDGSSVVTTIDIDLQDVAEKALLSTLIRHRAKAGTVVLMEVKTGNVKAIVNLTDTLGAYREYYNYAVGYSSEPGSTFKLPAIMAAIEDGHVQLSDTIHTGDGIFKYYDLVIRDDNYLKGGYGIINVEEVFEFSSNVGMAKIITSAYKNQPHRFIDRLYSMNINEPLGLSIRGEGRPVILYPGDKLWSGVTLASMSYGYALKMTPLQILTFYNAVANDGKMVKPRFATEIRNRGKLEQTFPPEIINPSICSKSTLKVVRKMMEGVVESGTAKNLQSETLKIAGKTGTTQIYNRRTGYSEKSYQASFVGYFPADAPKYSCIVVVYSPQDFIYHGALVAGPVFYDIASKVWSTDIALQAPINSGKQNKLEIPFSKNGYEPEIETVLDELDIKKLCQNNKSEWVTTEKTDEYIGLNTLPFRENLVPNVVSMGLKDAIYLLENMGLHVEVIGRGSVRKQSIPPGTRAVPGTTIKLEMSFTEG